MTELKERLESLRKSIEQEVGKPVEIKGPFGLRCEYLLKCDGKMMIITDINDHFVYDTGESTHEYKVDSIGWLNGFNNITAPLPEDAKEIVKLFV